MGLRPYCIMYRAEDILDWREGRKGNRRVLTYLKLKEQFEEPMDDNPNATKLVTRIRVLRLGNTGQCIFEL